MSIIPKAIALDLIKKGTAKAESLVHRDENGRRTYVSITRYDTQTIDHVLVGDGHLYGTATGKAIEEEFGICDAFIAARERAP